MKGLPGKLQKSALILIELIYLVFQTNTLGSLGLKKTTNTLKLYVLPGKITLQARVLTSTTRLGSR